ncbi:hypothetical protein ACHAQJ_005172 [Trichoderma viride]
MPTVQSERNRRRGVAASEAFTARRTRSATRGPRSPQLPTSQLGSSSGSGNGSRGGVVRRVRIHGPRTRPAPPSPAAVEDYYWPAVRRYINNGGHEGTNDVRVKVVCPICRDELPVRGLNPSNELLQHEGAVLIGCGHIFCRSCLAQTFRVQVEERHRRSCPVCRADMECQRCGDQSRVMDIPKAYDSRDDFEELSRTVPAGANRSANCIRCDAREWWIGQVKERLQDPLVQHDPVEAGFQRLMYDIMDQLEDDFMPTGMVEVEQLLLTLFQRMFMRLLRERERNIEWYVANQLRGGRSSWQ